MMIPQFGSLEIHSVPAAAKVLIDGNSKGATPIHLDSVLAKYTTVQLKKDGFYDSTILIEIASGKVHSYDIMLKKKVPLNEYKIKPAIEADLNKELLVSGRYGNGECSGGSEVWPFKIKFIHVDSNTGNFVGDIEWLTLSAIHEIKGTLSKKQLYFKETGIKKRGNAIIGPEYYLKLDSNINIIQGYWKYMGRGGSIWLKLNN
jgi:hypothetical protein